MARRKIDFSRIGKTYEKFSESLKKNRRRAARIKQKRAFILRQPKEIDILEARAKSVLERNEKLSGLFLKKKITDDLMVLCPKALHILWLNYSSAILQIPLPSTLKSTFANARTLVDRRKLPKNADALEKVFLDYENLIGRLRPKISRAESDEKNLVHGLKKENLLSDEDLKSANLI